MNLMSKYLEDMKNKEYRNENGFIIDFHEFAFLVEACIPPKPIARSSFWTKVIEHYYHQMTWDESNRLFEWITEHPNFDTSNDDCLLFYDRFDPDNQYIIETLYEGKREKIRCFKHQDKWQISKTKPIVEEYVMNVEKI